MYYLRTENNCIEFLTDEIHDIKDTDIRLSDEEYYSFFERQSNGESFRLVEVMPLSDNANLFDYVETFTPEQIEREETEIDLLRKEIAELKELIKSLV